MTDRELLELAAKAAGVLVKKNTVAVDSDDHLIGIKVRATEREKYHTWNPLTNDGDALRLAVKLHICTIFPMRGDTYKQCGAGQVGSERPAVMEPHDPDPLAATRRAIVRAAAEIGRNIK